MSQIQSLVRSWRRNPRSLRRLVSLTLCVFAAIVIILNYWPGRDQREVLTFSKDQVDKLFLNMYLQERDQASEIPAGYEGTTSENRWVLPLPGLLNSEPHPLDAIRDLATRDVKSFKEQAQTEVLSDIVLNSMYKPMADLTSFVGMCPISKEDNYFLHMSCDAIKYQATDKKRVIEHTKTALLPDDLEYLNAYLRDTGYGALIVPKGTNLAKADFASLPDWYRFTGSAVWLPDQKVHMMASRLVYSPNKIPIISLIRLQLYDGNFQELKGRRLRFLDVSDAEMKLAFQQYAMTGQDKYLDDISRIYPNILDIELDPSSRKDLLGPEDPRVAYKERGKIHEPVIVFNQDYRGARTMFATFPMRKTPSGGKVKTLQLRTSLMGDSPFEKNWTPFFDTLEPAPVGSSKGSMNVLYSMDPIKVYRCSLDTGDCTIVQTSSMNTQIDRESLTSIRGATSLRPVPRAVILRMLRREGITNQDYRMQMWVGFAKSHIDDCGCGHMLYRPTLVVLVKQDNSFRLDIMSDCIDFGKNVMAWNDHSSTYCDDGNSVFNPNEISFWHIQEDWELQDDAIKAGLADDAMPFYKDYMALTLSEADENVQVVFLKNVLNYILGAYERNQLVLGKKDVNGHVQERTKRVETCGLLAAVNYCERYSKSHKRPN